MRWLYLAAAVGSVLCVGLIAIRLPAAWWALLVVVPLILWGAYDRFLSRNSVKRIYPILGHFRYWLRAIGPELHQYFVEADYEGRPFSKEQRQIVETRATGASDVEPFGTQHRLYASGAEWALHSIEPAEMLEEAPRVAFGAGRKQPYHASLLNISAMSFGSLGPNAIRALNHGAKLGGFYHDTGEGAISPYHLVADADVVWEIGTGYFGCRTKEGRFDEQAFIDQAARPQVRMIELKLSQGAKPGHGGILPGAKVTPEIARTRGVAVGEDCVSPMRHSAFDSPTGLLAFIDRLREKSGGKPTGFKLCVGSAHELFAVAKAMQTTGIRPDFITVDGAGGGTGAAPFEFSDSVGLPINDALPLVVNTLVGTNVRDEVRVIASGKVITGFDLFRMLALGADTCNAARGFMFALGCIQALKCHTNRCPTGVTTLDPWRQNALDVATKKHRVASFHRNTVGSFLAVLAAAGLRHPGEIRPRHVFRRMDDGRIEPLHRVYAFCEAGAFLDGDVPEPYADAWREARPDRFSPAEAA